MNSPESNKPVLGHAAFHPHAPAVQAPQPTRVTRYVHHGVDVAVLEHLRGRHREHCLCYSGCTLFKPGQPDNCAIAQSIYENCVKHGVTTPVFECPKFTLG